MSKRIPVKKFWMNPDEKLEIKDTEFELGYTTLDGREWKYRVSVKPPGKLDDVKWFHELVWVIRDAKKKSVLPWNDPRVKGDRLKQRVNIENIGEGQPLDLFEDRTVIGWDSVSAIHFSDDLQNRNIKPEEAMRVIELYSRGTDNPESIVKKTGIDTTTAKTVVSLANKHDLLRT